MSPSFQFNLFGSSVVGERRRLRAVAPQGHRSRRSHIHRRIPSAVRHLRTLDPERVLDIPAQDKSPRGA